MGLGLFIRPKSMTSNGFLILILLHKAADWISKGVTQLQLVSQGVREPNDLKVETGPTVEKTHGIIVQPSPRRPDVEHNSLN
ncbi:hypothetical protein EDD17DRAFT_1544400 [Pisolithus thermaeus]|nr:hypothetical protein EDD17DRAFT_1544400 [Pisolithus thermaeus]